MDEYNIILSVSDSVEDIYETLLDIDLCSGYKHQNINVLFDWANDRKEITHRHLDTSNYDSLRQMAEDIYLRCEKWLYNHLGVSYNVKAN